MKNTATRGFLAGLGLAFGIALITVLWVFGWPWYWGSIDPNRQATNITFVQASGVSSGARYAASVKNVQQTADAPSCVFGGRDIFNPGAVDSQAGPGLKLSFVIGSPYSPKRVTVSVPEDKVNRVNAMNPNLKIRFVYDKLVWFYDHTWDPLVDKNADGKKGSISRCMAGLNVGQVLRIGLKRVILYGSSTS